MPFIDLPRCRIEYKFDGSAANPVLLLCNSLGADLSMWDGVVPYLIDHFFVLRYDGRGQGSSTIPDGPCTVEILSRDAHALLDALNIKEVYFCGQAMGSLIGICLAISSSSQIKKLILSNTAAIIGSQEFWKIRIEAIHQTGLTSLADMITDRWFTTQYVNDNPTVLKQMKAMLLNSSSAAYASYCEAIRNADFQAEIGQISVPTLVIGGAYDSVCRPHESRSVCDQINDASYIELPTAHMSPVEMPEAFAAAIRSFV